MNVDELEKKLYPEVPLYLSEVDPDRYYPLTDVQYLSGLARRTLYDHIKHRKLNTMQLPNGQHRVKGSEIFSWITHRSRPKKRGRYRTSTRSKQIINKRNGKILEDIRRGKLNMNEIAEKYELATITIYKIKQRYYK